MVWSRNWAHYICRMAYTHIISCLAGGLWGFLIAGALLFPVGIIHGIMIWFGAA